MSGNNQIFHGQIEWTKLNRKVLYHFVSFSIVNEILILKDNRIRAPARPITTKSTDRLAHEPLGTGIPCSSYGGLRRCAARDACLLTPNSAHDP